MSCYIPDFLFAVARQAMPDQDEQPLVLVGDVAYGRVLGASPAARTCGVGNGMAIRQALMRCPDLVVRVLDTQRCEEAHATLLSTLVQTGLPVEDVDWGSTYVDLSAVARERDDAQWLCADLGRQVRRALGEGLQPALGWDTGKFTARAAAMRSKPGQMRLVSQCDETQFLKPLPISLLPLPVAALQQLSWLGIRTLERFAKLPLAAVQQRFGPAGQLAQRWAQGHDDRPVRPTVNAKPEPIDVDLEVPTADQALVLDTALHALEPHLETLAWHLEGCRRIRAELHFIDGSTRAFTHIFVQPVCTAAFIRAMLAQELQRMTWPGELVTLQLLLLDTGELTPTQLSLFPELNADSTRPAPFAELVAKLAPRYGRIFWRAQLGDEQHPLAERRFCFAQEL